MKKVRNAISYLLVMAGFGVTFAVFPNYFFGLLLVFWVVLGIYDLIALHSLVKKLVINLKLPKEAIVKKNPAGIFVEVWNPTVFFSAEVTLKLKICNEFYGETTQAFFRIPVYGKEKEKISLPTEFQTCGKIRIVLEEVKVLGILGIVEVKQKQTRKKEDVFYIYPEHMDWQKRFEKQQGFSARIHHKNKETIQKGNDFAEVSDIREYIPGDRMRDIHWKLSAKKEMLMVKEHVNRSDTRQAILVEIAESSIEEGHGAIEEMLELLTGVMKSFLRQEMGITLFWWNEKKQEICLKEVQNIHDISKAMELLLEARVYRENLFLETMWKSKNVLEESYVWIGKNENTLEYKVFVKGTCGVIAKWEEG